MSERGSHSRSSKQETGQAIVIIAMGFIVLLAFTGLVVDVARVFVQRGELRRAVDAAGLAATGQFRQNATGAQIAQAAINLIRAHGITDPLVDIETCNLDGTAHNTALCPPPGQPQRKLVHVKAEAPVPMLFLQLIGIPTVKVAGDSTAEAASVDAVLILDTSESQAYDPPSGYAFTHDENKGCKASDVGPDNVYACIKACNDSPDHPCYPLQKVKDSAKDFVDRLYPNYDRIAIVAYNREASAPYEMGLDLALAKQRIGEMRATDHMFSNPGEPCSFGQTPGQVWKCGSSNPGGGLLRASLQYGIDMRPEALWVAIFLSSGGLNATDPYVSSDADSADFGFCPAKVTGNPMTKDDPPPCRDQQWSVHHPMPTITTTGTSLYDAEDYAYDQATYMGTEALPHGAGGMGVLIFTIALGQKAVCTTGQIYVAPTPGTPLVCGNWNPYYEDQGSLLPNTGELFLRYVAAIGDNGRPDDPCTGIPSGSRCGNYYFAPTGDDLRGIFLEIAGRIFTRLSG